jgi:DNA primase
VRAQVLAATDLVELVGQSVRLIRRGRDFVGLCPFHQEKTPSFKVSAANQYFYCFGCKAAGSALDFVMRRDRVEYIDALRWLAERANIPMPSGRGRQDAGKRQLLLDAHLAALGVFQKLLNDAERGAAARKYLADRGFSQETIRRFGIGLSADAWDGLIGNPAMRKFAPALLAEAGLCKQRAGGNGFYDTFRNRLIFPIRDETGRVIAFGGRVMPGSAVGSDDPAKYLNSPESPLFSKSRCVYGLDLARGQMVATRTAVVVEGYTDVAMAHQFGVENVVSVLGTAITQQHVAALRRFADRIVLLFDADAAGDAAVARVVELFLTQPIEIAIATMPGGLDPDELLLKQGAEAFGKVVAEAEDALSFQWRMLRRRMGDAPDLTVQQRAVTQYLELLGSARAAGPIDDVRWGAALARVSRLTNIPVDMLHRRFGRGARQTSRRRERTAEAVDAAAGSGLAKSENRAAVDPAQVRAEGHILGALFLEPSLWQKVQVRIGPADFADPGCRALAQIYWQQLAEVGEPIFNDFIALLAEKSGDGSETYGALSDVVGFDRVGADVKDSGRGATSDGGESGASGAALGNLAIGLMELAEQRLDSALKSEADVWQQEHSVKAEESEKRKRAIEKGIWEEVEYLLSPGARRNHGQRLRGLRSAKVSGDVEEVELLRKSAQAASERRKNL